MQNTKKLLFSAILAIAALAASDSNCAAGLKKIRVSDKWNEHTLTDVYVDPNGTMLDVKRAFEVAEAWPIGQQIVLDIRGKEYDDNDPVRGVDVVYLNMYPSPLQEQREQPWILPPAAPLCPGCACKPESHYDAWEDDRFWGEPE